MATANPTQKPQPLQGNQLCHRRKVPDVGLAATKCGRFCSTPGSDSARIEKQYLGLAHGTLQPEKQYWWLAHGTLQPAGLWTLQPQPALMPQTAVWMHHAPGLKVQAVVSMHHPWASQPHTKIWMRYATPHRAVAMCVESSRAPSLTSLATDHYP